MSFLLFLLRPLQPCIYSTSQSRSRIIFPLSRMHYYGNFFEIVSMCICFLLSFETICRESDLGKIFWFIIFNFKKYYLLTILSTAFLFSISLFWYWKDVNFTTNSIRARSEKKEYCRHISTESNHPTLSCRDILGWCKNF